MLYICVFSCHQSIWLKLYVSYDSSVCYMPLPSDGICPFFSCLSLSPPNSSITSCLLISRAYVSPQCRTTSKTEVVCRLICLVLNRNWENKKFSLLVAGDLWFVLRYTFRYMLLILSVLAAFWRCPFFLQYFGGNSAFLWILKYSGMW